MPAYRVAFDHDVGRDREHVRARQRRDMVRARHPLGEVRTQNPDRPVVDDAIDVAVDHDADIPSRHRAIEDQPADRHHRVGDVPGNHLKLVVAEIVGVRARR